MGLAILPARLKDELFLLRECLLGKKNINDYEILQKHRLWYEDIKENNIIKEESIDDLLADELTKKFVCVLEDAGVFKMNEEGIDSFIHFVKSIDEWEEK